MDVDSSTHRDAGRAPTTAGPGAPGRWLAALGVARTLAAVDVVQAAMAAELHRLGAPCPREARPR